MQLLAILVLIFSTAAAVTGLLAGDRTVILLAAVGFLCAYTTYRSRGISIFLRIFAAIFAAETVIFGSIYLVAATGLWPSSLADYEFPISLPLTMALFAIGVYAISFIPVMRSMTRIADRYFDTNDNTRARIWPFPAFGARERRVAAGMVIFLVLINQVEVGIDVRLSFFSRDMYNALQDKNAAVFWTQMLFVFTPWAFFWVGTHVIEYIVQSTLIIRWRLWLTNDYIGRWLDSHTHYRMSLAGGGADNPDQRIQEDIDRFINGGGAGAGIYSFTISLISTLSSLVSFSIVLWGLSANFTLPFTNISVPGFLFWLALVYAVIGSVMTGVIGYPLVALNFAQQRYEADFRFSLARLREYAEQVALLCGEQTEKATLRTLFGAIVINYFRIIACRKNLLAATSVYGQLSEIIPYLIVAPFFFAGKVALGIMMQTARSFLQVQGALNFFVENFVSLASFKAVLDRLTSFEAAIATAKQPAFLPHRGADTLAAREHLDIESLDVRLPDGRKIIEGASLRLNANEPVIFTGRSGSGKSTLFRAISGIWPYGQGAITLPRDATILLFPQRPYIPIGTLRAAITYPGKPDSYENGEIVQALRDAQLNDFLGELDHADNWQQRLSGGEQQRLAIARAILAKPDWLFLDEMTSAMDEEMESEIYNMLAAKLPHTTIVSIGHRANLAAFHKRHLKMQPSGAGIFAPIDVERKAAEMGVVAIWPDCR